MFKTTTRLFLLCLLAIRALAQQPLEEIVVTGEFRERPLEDLPSSISVLQSDTIENREARHLDEILVLVPNVNLSGTSSRSRFFQIRGIGGRSQFDEPLNPSVGLIIDGVDLSTAASAATLFDVDQVEVFRGPQGTRYGANALAGLINVQTRPPTEQFEARAAINAGNYDAWTVNGSVSGPIGERVSGRLSAQQHASDGFIENSFLGRDDTNERDELSVRGKLRWLASNTVTVDALLGYVDLDNGYDAFSLDNDRTTRSDEPGRDAQETAFGGIDVAWAGRPAFTLEASAAAASADSVYGYDEDWTYVGFHPAGYSSTDYYFRDRTTLTSELRMISEEPGRVLGDSTDWVIGLYALDSEIDLRRLYTFLSGPFASTFSIDRLALFGQLDAAISPRTTLTAGVRYERHESTYSDSEGVTFAPDDDLLGWRISVDHALTDAMMGYASASGGYKAGGFNTDGTLDVDLRQYEPETLTNIELGLKGSLFGGRLDARLALFQMWREDVQIASSITRVRDDGSTAFIQFTGNAAEGTNRGLEAELVLAVNERFELSAGLGLLDSEYDAFINARGENLDGREQAHAPNYQFSVMGRYRFADGWYAQLGAEGRDAFYFSDSHDERSKAYELYNAAIGYSRDGWDVRLWGRNLTDQDQLIHGFFFGNDPRTGYESRGYTQLGEPRRIGLSVSYMFD